MRTEQGGRPEAGTTATLVTEQAVMPEVQPQIQQVDAGCVLLSAGESLVEEALGALLQSPAAAGRKVGQHTRKPFAATWLSSVHAERRQHNGRRLKYELHVASRSCTPTSPTSGARSPSPLLAQPVVPEKAASGPTIASLTKNINHNALWKGKAEVGAETNATARSIYPVVRCATPTAEKQLSSSNAMPLLMNGPRGPVKVFGQKRVPPGTPQLQTCAKPRLFARHPGETHSPHQGEPAGIWLATPTEKAARVTPAGTSQASANRTASPSRTATPRGAASSSRAPSPPARGDSPQRSKSRGSSNPGSRASPFLNFHRSRTPDSTSGLRDRSPGAESSARRASWGRTTPRQRFSNKSLGGDQVARQTSESCDDEPETPARKEKRRSEGFHQLLRRLSGDQAAVSGASSARTALASLRLTLDREARIAKITACRKTRLDAGQLGGEDADRAMEMFNRHALQKPTARGKRIWTGAALLEALEDFGIKAHTRTEKMALNTVLPKPEEEDIKFRDFCEVILQARDRMQAATTSMIFTAWLRQDVEEKGVLDFQGIMMLLQSLNPELETDVELSLKAKSVVKQLDRGGDNQFNFQEVEQIVWRLRELKECSRRAQVMQIRDRYSLDPVIFKEFQSQLIDLHNAFLALSEQTRRDGEQADDPGAWTRKRLMMLQSQFGLARTKKSVEREWVPEENELVLRKFRNSLTSERSGTFASSQKDDSLRDNEGSDFEAEDSVLAFERVLVLLKKQREAQMLERLEEVANLFKHYDKDRSGELEMHEICQVLADLDLQPSTPLEQQAIAQMIEEVDADGSGQFDFNEFVFMIQRIYETFAKMSFKHESDTAMSLSFSEEKVRDLREVFHHFDSTGAGELDKQELGEAVRHLGFRIPAQRLWDITDRIDTYKPGTFNFLQFLAVLKAVGSGEPHDTASNDAKGTSSMTLTRTLSSNDHGVRQPAVEGGATPATFDTVTAEAESIVASRNIMTRSQREQHQLLLKRAEEAERQHVALPPER